MVKNKTNILLHYKCNYVGMKFYIINSNVLHTCPTSIKAYFVCCRHC